MGKRKSHPPAASGDTKCANCWPDEVVVKGGGVPLKLASARGLRIVSEQWHRLVGQQLAHELLRLAPEIAEMIKPNEALFRAYMPLTLGRRREADINEFMRALVDCLPAPHKAAYKRALKRHLADAPCHRA